jgi:glucose-6-phosphate isomerase
MVALHIDSQVYDEALSAMETTLLQSVQMLQKRTGTGNDYLGWIDLPVAISSTLRQDLVATATNLRNSSDCVVMVGIGGSYLGGRAVIAALKDDFATTKPNILYAGHHLSEDYYAALMQYLDTVDYSIIVISKSGTTTEPAIAFRLLRTHCQKKYGCSESKKRIVCITDRQKGVLHAIVQKEGYPAYVIPNDVGGRFSVFSPVGLLPIAVAGFDIHAFLEGAEAMRKQLLHSEQNMASTYAMCRNYFLHKGFTIEVLSVFAPELRYLTEWWKQLFGESEGKEGKGIFPVNMVFSTDLHSLGQYMQEGQRIMFETFLSVLHPKKECRIPVVQPPDDDLHRLEGKRLFEINNVVENAVLLAHQQGNVPVMQISIDKLDERNIGELLYFFEYACVVSAYMLGVNPFNQPGVEAYKKNMYALLAKQGDEQTK